MEYLLLHREWLGEYWLRLFLADRLYLAVLVAVIVLAMVIMRVRKH